MNIHDYKPKAYHIPTDGEDIDVDGSNDGDYVVCPIHPEEIIYVMGTHFWHLEGGANDFGGWDSLQLLGLYCPQCNKKHRFSVGSYSG